MKEKNKKIRRSPNLD